MIRYKHVTRQAKEPQKVIVKTRKCSRLAWALGILVFVVIVYAVTPIQSSAPRTAKEHRVTVTAKSTGREAERVFHDVKSVTAGQHSVVIVQGPIITNLPRSKWSVRVTP